MRSGNKQAWSIIISSSSSSNSSSRSTSLYTPMSRWQQDAATSSRLISYMHRLAAQTACYWGMHPQLGVEMTRALCLTFKFSVTLSNSTRFSKFLQRWKRMKFATKVIRHYPLYLRNVATLPWKIKKVKCSANVQQIWKNANKLHFYPFQHCHLSTNVDISGA